MEANKTLQFLAQLRPSTTAAELLFSPNTGEQVIAVQLIVANLTSVNRKYSIYFDNDGTTANETTALAFEVGILKNTTEIIELSIPLRDSAGSIYVQTDTADGINFTLNGLK
jgi:hypothetical protein